MAELRVCEFLLKCKVEGIEKDQLLVRFSHIDEADPRREFSFVLDVGVTVYKGKCFL
jgi:kinetochore protein Spc25, fungi type